MREKGRIVMKEYAIITGGRCHYTVVGANLSDSCERYAASELQKYLYESTGVFVPYISDRCARRGPEILIGADTRNGRDLVSEEELLELGDDGFLIKTLEEDILITGKTSRGTLYGVYEFLRRFAGFRAFTKDVEKVDALDGLIIPQIYVTEKPDFEYRDAYFRFAFDGAFCAKNRLNTTLGDISAEKGGSFKFFNCHHSFDDLVPPVVYFEEHPEYFAFHDGRRTKDQLCLSEPRVLEIATAQVKSWIAEHPECRVFSVAQNDNERYCTCERCRRIDEEEGSPAGSVIRFVNALAEEIEKEHPDILIHTFAYQYSRVAPKKARPKSNVIVRLCNIECEWGDSLEAVAKRDPEGKCAEFLENIREWSEICDRLYVWDYAVNFSNYLQPFPCFYSMAENIRYYKQHGVKGVLQEGNFSYGGGASLDDLKSYIIAGLLWNADADVDLMIDEFCRGVYGNAAPYIKEYISVMTEAVKGYRMTLFDYPNAAYLNDSLLDRCDEIFKRAIDAAENDEVRRRVEREYLAIRYSRIVRIADDKRRAEETDAFAKDVRSFRLTEIMERIHLDDSFEYMKREQYATDRKGRYRMYYIVR